MPGYKRRYRKKTTFRKKAIKKRIRSRIAKRKAYSYDGIVRMKFQVTYYATVAGTAG